MVELWNFFRDGLTLAHQLDSKETQVTSAHMLAHLGKVRRYLFFFGIMSALATVFLVVCWLFGVQSTAPYLILGLAILSLLVCNLLLFAPVFLIQKRLRARYPEVAADLSYWFRLTRIFFFNGLSIAMVIGLTPLWRNVGALPLLFLVVACWVLYPVCARSDSGRRVYSFVHVFQFLLLTGLLMLQVAFPQHAKQVGWLAGRAMGNSLTSSISQKEVTSEWNTLTWFNNQGEPMVWYSGDQVNGFRLWAAPGFDPDSGTELRAVTVTTERDLIIGSFAAENSRRIAENRKQDEAAKAALQAEQMEREVKRKREEAELSDKLRADEEREKRAFIERNINVTKVTRSPGLLLVSVAIANNGAQLDEDFSVELAGGMPAKNATFSGTLFAPQIVTGGSFERLILGDTAEVSRLRIADYSDAMFLGNYRIGISTNSDLGVVTADLHFEGALHWLTAARTAQTMRTSVQGAGFDSQKAIAAAKERLRKWLSSDGNLKFSN